ncbi:MAG: helix-turn-helix domain-containing protein, partial [Thermoactinomyces sp.]
MSGLSTRQLERKFNEFLGVSPKKLSMISRFDSARKTLFRHPHADLLDLTFRYGYFDYFHFTKDFKRFFGMTPRDFKNWIISQSVQGKDKDVVFLQDENDP